MSVMEPIIAADAIESQPQAYRLSLADQLCVDLNPKLAGIYEDLRQEVLQFAEAQGPCESAEKQLRVVADFCDDQRRLIKEIQETKNRFLTRHGSAVDDAERRAAIVEFARELGADRKALRGDKVALDRFFDADAVLERAARRISERERALAYAAERIGPLARSLFAIDAALARGDLHAKTVAELIASLRSWPGDHRVCLAAHRATACAFASAIPASNALWFDAAVSETRRVCLSESEDVWVQCAAFDALTVLSPISFAPVANRRIERSFAKDSMHTHPDDVFVFRHIARLVCQHQQVLPDLSELIPSLANHRDGAVRQLLAENVHLLDGATAEKVTRRMRSDRDPQVRAMLFASPSQYVEAFGAAPLIGHLQMLMKREEDEFVLRIGLSACAEIAALVAIHDPANLDQHSQQLFGIIANLQERAVSMKVQRWADEAREQIWLCGDGDAQDIARLLHETIEGQREAECRKVADLRPYLDSDPEKVGRVMAVIAQNDFGLSLEDLPRPKLHRGEIFRRRLWRIMFEGRNSATDKRQAFFHTKGRHFPGTMLAPSAKMAELAPTKVPGEPLVESSEGGWRNYIPLLDQVLSALDHGKPVEIFTSAGITQIDPPEGVRNRLTAFWKISRKFEDLARLRNRDPKAFIEALREHGVEVSFRGYGDAQSDPNPHITEMFSAGGALAALIPVWDNIAAYASTVFENSLLELAIFLGVASLYFFGRHMALGWHARRLRDGLALVLGGWGTRGKSGTERLKAGLMNALGPSIVSKTTGCEAMFLIGTPFGDLTEMFLFRPYDKATIWEQYNLMKTARGLDSKVFLWECMGLNPSYVRVLQQDWMRDDIGTITNTYPDHEDVQGPAGRNIPEVMCEFIPQGSTLLTTEEEMLPILREGADKAGTTMREIGWKEAGLIHQSLLERFPYEEHPYNIALVTAMGDELGLEPDFCVKEMADRVVADLGVLKTYPRSQIDGRTLEFVMGMSANERFGAMGNWDRMGFGEHDLAKDPEIFVTTVVNNRADRVPRSRVFARMLVRDVSADKHFLIGSNIDGLVGFIEEEWSLYVNGLSLFEGDATPQERLLELVKNQRIPVNETELSGLLGAMLAPHDGQITLAEAQDAAANGKLAEILADKGIMHGEDIARHYAAMADLSHQFAELEQAVEKAAGPSDELDKTLRALLSKAFQAKLVPVQDVYMKGEMIVRLVAQHTPPGLTNRIMGMQNIKGTGLDWVYRWQAWETAWKACQQTLSDDEVAADRGFRILSSFQEFGVLSQSEVLKTIMLLRRNGDFSNAQLDALEQRVAAQIAKFSETKSDETEGADTSPARAMLAMLSNRLLNGAEAFLDSGDAVRRRRKADKIYQDLIAERVSLQRAAAELKDLTARQKGGWLAASLTAKKKKQRGLRRAA